jgi:arabinan endo-1,5-alpha-L-arabinosidase
MVGIMTKQFPAILVVAVALLARGAAAADTNAPTETPAVHTVRLTEERLRDSCVWPDESTRTYYLVSSSGRHGPNHRAAVVAFTSKDLETWEGPHVIFEVPENFWANRGIWAPELHSYQNKFYLFLTFNTDDPFPEQWRDWLPRVKRGSQVLVGDSPLGPFRPFENHSTLPVDMMTLDGTFWVEDGVPYMVFCHEWVQIKDGTVEMIQLKDDLSATAGEPKRLFHGSDAPWSKKSEQYGCHVTDAPWLYRTKNGKLLMLWSSGSATGYAVGIATSKSGKLAGPWEQQAQPLFADDGGHPMLFHRFDGQLMMILHQPNKAPNERARLFEMEDTGDTIRLKKP